MTSFKEMEDNLKNFIIQEQSDAHNARNTNRGKYNNIKLWMDPTKNVMPHLFIRISISEACYSLGDFSKIPKTFAKQYELFTFKSFILTFSPFKVLGTKIVILLILVKR